MCLHARLPILEQKGIDASARELFVAVSQMSEWCAGRCKIMLANFVRSFDSLRRPNSWFHSAIQDILEDHKWWSQQQQ